MPIFHIIVLAIGFFVLGSSCFFSFKEFTLNGKKEPIYLRLFFIIPLAAFIISILVIIYVISGYLNKPRINLMPFESVYVILHFSLWSIFFIMYFRVKRSNPIFLRITLFLFIVGLSLVAFLFETPYKYISMFAFQNVIICIYCMGFITYQLFYNPRLNLQHEPETWIIGSLFLYCAVSSPLLISLEYVKLAEMHSIYKFTLPLANFLLVVHHALIIKSAFVARKNRAANKGVNKVIQERTERIKKYKEDKFGFDLGNLE